MTTSSPPRQRPRAPRPPMDARIRERRAEVRRAGARRRRRAVMVVVVLLLAAAAAVGVTRSSLFAITAVRVDGVKGEQAALVRTTAAVQTGQNLLSADLDDALRRTRALPWVAGAQVRREPPSTVAIVVTPRRPAAVIDVAGRAWIVDAGGVVIESGDDRQLPRIDSLVPAAPVPGHVIGDAAARNALELQAALPADVRRAVLQIEAVGARSLRLELALHELSDPAGYRKGATVWVRMGSVGDVEEQVRVMRALLGQLRSSQTRVPAEIDVRVAANPVVIP